MMSGETRAHRELKRAALYWAQVSGGYEYAGVEVRVPNSNYRADVTSVTLDPGGARSLAGGSGAEGGVGGMESEKRVGKGGGGAQGEEGVVGTEARGDGDGGVVAVFECKQSRADFLKDSREEAETLARLRDFHERREKLERQLGVHYPHLRKGETLFPEFDGLHGEEVPHEGLRKLRREIGVLEKRVFGKTKFEKMVRWRCAHVFYLVTSPGVVREVHEVPSAWGWLEVEGGAGGEELEGAGGEEAGILKLVVRKRPLWVEAEAGLGRVYLERLAAGATRRVNEALGVSGEALWEGRRGRG